MSNLLVLICAAILMSCSSFEEKRLTNISYPEHDFSRQMDERSLRSGFLER